jgi:hypothetical protein
VKLEAADVSFYWAAMAQLEPGQRAAFVERVTRNLGSHPDPGPGDVDRAVRVAMADLWTPLPDDTARGVSRWAGSAPHYERASKRNR